jgi:hypothetical protein
VYLKSIGDCIRSRDESIDTHLDPPLFWLDNIFKFILSCQQFDNCSQCLPPVSTTLLKLVEKFDAGVVDTGGAP